jgi:hypothetical protein
MKYAAPSKILEFLASHGPSSVQTEAIALLLAPLPSRWPVYERGSRESLLRRLAANDKKSARARLEALKELLAMIQRHDSGGPKHQPESRANANLEPPAVAPCVPPDGPSSSVNGQETSELRRLEMELLTHAGKRGMEAIDYHDVFAYCSARGWETHDARTVYQSWIGTRLW